MFEDIVILCHILWEVLWGLRRLQHMFHFLSLSLSSLSVGLLAVSQSRPLNMTLCFPVKPNYQCRLHDSWTDLVANYSATQPQLLWTNSPGQTVHLHALEMDVYEIFEAPELKQCNASLYKHGRNMMKNEHQSSFNEQQSEASWKNRLSVICFSYMGRHLFLPCTSQQGLFPSSLSHLLFRWVWREQVIDGMWMPPLHWCWMCLTSQHEIDCREQEFNSLPNYLDLLTADGMVAICSYCAPHAFVDRSKANRAEEISAGRWASRGCEFWRAPNQYKFHLTCPWLLVTRAIWIFQISLVGVLIFLS